MKTKTNKHIKTTSLVIDILAITLLVSTFSVVLINEKANRLTRNLNVLNYDKNIKSDNRIYFLNTGTSDCIIIYSNGHLAIIDSGEDSDDPRNLKRENNIGYQQDILNFIKNHFADTSNQVYIDMIVGTHAHSDHIGGFDTIIMDDDINIDKAYLRPYDENAILLYERENYDNQEVYDQMITAINTKNILLIDDINEDTFEFGDFTMQFLNTYKKDGTIVGENENSLGILLTINGKKVFLASDINNLDGDESRIQNQIGKVDILKVGHHGYAGSSTYSFINKLKPQLAIITNDLAKISEFTTITMTLLDVPIMTTVNANGIMIAFNNDGYQIYDNIN